VAVLASAIFAGKWIENAQAKKKRPSGGERLKLAKGMADKRIGESSPQPSLEEALSWETLA
jgi:hypothetical protein